MARQRRARGGMTPAPGGEESSIAPVPDPPRRRLRRRLPRAKRGRLAARRRARGEARARAAEGRPLRAKLGIDPTAPGHPPRPRGRPAEAARVPGRRPHGRPDHRGLHRPGSAIPPGSRCCGRCSSREEIERNAETFQDQAFRVLRPGAHRGAAQQRVARHADGGPAAPAAPGDGRAGDGARRLHQADRRRGARSRCWSCSIRCTQGYDSVAVRGGRRARGHRPEVQPAARTGRPAGLRAAAAGGPDDADPAGPRRRAADEQVARQLRRRDRCRPRRCSAS